MRHGTDGDFTCRIFKSLLFAATFTKASQLKDRLLYDSLDHAYNAGLETPWRGKSEIARFTAKVLRLYGH